MTRELITSEKAELQYRENERERERTNEYINFFPSVIIDPSSINPHAFGYPHQTLAKYIHGHHKILTHIN